MPPACLLVQQGGHQHFLGIAGMSMNNLVG